MESSLLLLRELLSLYLLFVSLHGHVHGNTRIPNVKQEIRCGAFQLSTGELIEIFSCLVKREEIEDVLGLQAALSIILNQLYHCIFDLGERDLALIRLLLGPKGLLNIELYSLPVNQLEAKVLGDDAGQSRSALKRHAQNNGPVYLGTANEL